MDNRLNKKTHGVYGLAQIVAGGGQKLIFIPQRLLSFLFAWRNCSARRALSSSSLAC
jgi:hypothetical protein